MQSIKDEAVYFLNQLYRIRNGLNNFALL